MTKRYNNHPIAIIIFLQIALFGTSIAQQALQLPQQESLEQSLTAFVLKERDTKLTTFDTRQSGDWKELLPTLGITYTITNQPRPTISWSPLAILDRRDKKRRHTQDRQTIILTYELHLSDKIFKLRQLIADYHLDYEALVMKEATLAIDEQLYDIALATYDKEYIKPSQYLTEKKKIITARTNVAELRRTLQKSKSHILYFSKYER